MRKAHYFYFILCHPFGCHNKHKDRKTNDTCPLTSELNWVYAQLYPLIAHRKRPATQLLCLDCPFMKVVIFNSPIVASIHPVLS